MSNVPRYAVYYSPAVGSPLAAFGASVLGYDAVSGGDVGIAQDLACAFPDWRQRVAEPARYGFHATLKAPFELDPGASEADLLTATAELAGATPPVALGKLHVAVLSGFVALIPAEREAGQALAQCVVEQLDHLRAPLGAADRRRRLEAPLTPRQIDLLDRWGYPYVAEEFRFHMTLTGAADGRECAQARDILAQLYATIDEPVAIDGLSVFKQPSRSQGFHVLRRYPLGQAPL